MREGEKELRMENGELRMEGEDTLEHLVAVA